MIRLTMLSLFVAFLAIYAFRDWFKSLCGLILLLAVVEHPDFPKSLGGVQGANPWNILLLFVGIAWLRGRKIEGLKLDLPRGIAWLLVIYFTLIFYAVYRMITNPAGFIEYYTLTMQPYPGFFSQISEYIINSLKWVVPGLLLYDGCRSKERLRWATYTIVGVYTLLAIQVIRWMPLGALGSGEELQRRALKIIMNEVGFHRVNMSMMLSGGSWACFCLRDMIEDKRLRIALLGMSGICFFGMALTGGRMGYVTWAAIGFMFAVFRWRKLLLVGPAILVMMIMFVPAVQERFMAGFTEDTVDTSNQVAEAGFQDSDGPDLYTVTSGRAFIWPMVVEDIRQKPLLGHGREAMLRTGLAVRIWRQFGESFPHPHNAYLQWLQDNGIIGFIPIFIFYSIAMYGALSLFVDKNDRECRAVGGMTVALISALLVAAMGSQSFYPREGSLPMWAAMGLALRCYVQRQRWLGAKSKANAGYAQYSSAT